MLDSIPQLPQLPQLTGRLTLTPAEALLLVGLSRDLHAARKTAANRIAAGTFPFPVRRLFGRRCVLVEDFVAALRAEGVELSVSTQPNPGADSPARRGRGRPRKSA